MTEPISTAHTIPPPAMDQASAESERIDSHEQQLREIRGALRAMRVEQLEQREMLEEILRRLPGGT